jgi:dipeptidyl aminopeptidase/acylaminoacyl peptidase
MTRNVDGTKVKKYTIEQFFNTESIISNSISFDDKHVLFSSDKSGIYNAYIYSLAENRSRQVTVSTDNAIHAISFFPNDNRFLYLSDKGGNEILHIFVQNEDGVVVELTTGENERAEFYGWSKDGNSFFYGSNKRNPSYMDVYEMEIASFESACIFTNEGGYDFGSISPDKRYISLSKVSSSNDSDIYLYDRENGSLSQLTAHEGDINYFPQKFSKDSFYFLTDENHEYTYLKKLHLGTRQSEEVAKENWDITSSFFSNDNQYLVYTINNDAKTEIKILDEPTLQLVELPSLPEGQIINLQISKSGNVMTFLLNSSNSPANLYVFDFETTEVRKLTDTLNPEIDPNDLATADVIRFASFDGLEIPAIYYKPFGSTGEKVPALVYVHGGPGGQSRTDYNPLFQYLVNQGYAILAVNNRGSSGYGKTFFSAADLKHGEIDLEDCIQGKNFLQGQDDIDEDRIGIIGGSYGGYMVLAALAFRPEEFKLGVDIFGVSNWERTLKSIPSWWESFRDALYKKLGNPFTQTDYIRSISPLFHADKINKPLIVL